MRRKICSLMAAFTLCCSVIMSPVVALPVQATALPIPIGAADTETLMIIWNLLMNGLLVSGVDPASLNYESEKALFNSFMGGLSDSLIGGNPFMEVTYTADGAVYYMEYNDFPDSWYDGTGALQIPDELAWADYRVIDGGGGSDPDGGDNQDPEEPYSDVISFCMGNGFLGYMADWISSLWNGAVEGLNPDDYYFPSADDLPQYQFKGAYERDADGNYVVRGCMLKDASSFYVIIELLDSFVNPVVAVSSSTFPVYFNYFTLNNTSLSPVMVRYEDSYYNTDGTLQRTSSGRSYNTYAISEYSMNFPIFASEEAALAYLQGLATDAPLNGLCYDYPALAEAVPSVLSAYASGVQVSPNSLPALNAAINAALEALPEPAPAIDPAENTEAYVQAVTDAAVSVAPAPAPDPDPEPAPNPDPDSGMEIVKNYQFDLTQVFPFCLPFDLIRFLEALAAEPEAPRFELPFVVPSLGIDITYVIDLSFMDDVMEIFRYCELVGFAFALIMLTPKMIKW